MFETIVWSAFVVGIVSAVSLPLGAATTRFWRPDDRVTAILVAIFSKTLVPPVTDTAHGLNLPPRESSKRWLRRPIAEMSPG